MPTTNSAAVIVARFLKANHYTKVSPSRQIYNLIVTGEQTLGAYLTEAGLPEDAGDTKPGDWTIEQILEEKTQYDSSLAFERQGEEGNSGWPLPAPDKAVEPVRVNSNVLCVSGTSNPADRDEAIYVTAADRSWSQLTAKEPFERTQSITNAHGSPVLSISVLHGRYVFSTSMSGQLMLHDLEGRLLDSCRHHLKYAVQVVAGVVANNKWIVATAGWDQKIHIYAPQDELVENYTPSEDAEEPYIEGVLGEPIYTINMATNPESMVLVRHPDTSELYLIAARRDSTFLYYYRITPTASESSSSQSSKTTYSVQETGKQNLAPHSNAWIAFSPACLSVCPTDQSLLAVATSQLPHMKLIIVRLLFPTSGYTSGVPTSEPTTQAAQARAALAIQNIEDKAIQLHVSTMAPQTPYSTPQVVWRPGGKGVFVNADDGVIRGIDTQSGKVVSYLKGHEVGSKVRTLYAGYEAGNDGSAKKEILVSGGFDKKVFIWRVNETSGS
jgi:WD40 repeat protein